MLLIVLLVIFTMAMFLWLLALLGQQQAAAYSPWLAFFSCLVLGIVVFLLGTGVIVLTRGP
jgi:hypothetical protein